MTEIEGLIIELAEIMTRLNFSKGLVEGLGKSEFDGSLVIYCDPDKWREHTAAIGDLFTLTEKHLKLLHPEIGKHRKDSNVTEP